MKEKAPYLHLYSLNREDFLTPATHLVTRLDYNEKVNRDNFMIWLATGFQVSLGSLGVQKAFLEWWRIERQLDWKRSAINFFDLGAEIPSWNFLSEAEIDLFGRSFRKVGDHGNNRRLSDTDILHAARSQIIDALINGSIPSILPTEDLIQLPPDELKKLLSTYATRIRNERLGRAGLQSSP